MSNKQSTFPTFSAPFDSAQDDGEGGRGQQLITNNPPSPPLADSVGRLSTNN